MDRYTNFSWVFRALGERQREFNWLLTDLECIGFPPDLSYDEIRSKNNKLWFSGDRLTEIVDTNSIQFIWGVLSGFRPDVKIDLEHLSIYPVAEGNSKLWQPNVKIQHPLAEVEIICWDSAATILLSQDKDLTARFRNYFPDAVDLDKRNLTGKQRH